MVQKTAKLADCDVVILCGGEGTRVRHLLPEGTPKVAVEINRKSFLAILIQHLISAGFRRIVFCTGYGHEMVRDTYGRSVWYVKTVAGETWLDEWNAPVFTCSKEATPLGTAGAVRNAAQQIRSDHFWIINGDTYCDVDYGAMLDYHLESKSVITVAHDDQMRHVGTFVASKRLLDLIPEVDGKYDMEDLFTRLGNLREPVGWFRTEARYWDIGSPEGLEAFRREEPWKK